MIVGIRHVLRDAPHPIHEPWLEAARQALRPADLAPLRELISPRRYTPDFLMPPPTDGAPSIEHEFERLRATPPDKLRADLDRAHREGPLPAALEALEREPDAALEGLTRVLERCWLAALEPHWERIRALHEADVAFRAPRLAFGNVSTVLDELHPSMHFQAGRLEVRDGLVPSAEQRDGIHRAHRTRSEISLNGRGLLLVPAVFAWPTVCLLVNDAWQPTLYYSPTGAAGLWGSPREGHRALEAALGRARARVLAGVSAPTTTDELARRQGVSTSTASYHLLRLRQAGLLEAKRDGLHVMYQLTARGRALLDLFE